MANVNKSGPPPVKQEEKTQAMLNRWIAMKREMALGELVRRPTNPLDVDNLKQCQDWREQCMQEVAKYITDIQNAGMSENQIRAMNDLINKILREKSLWEDRIRQLGGPDYKKIVVRQVDSQGQEIPGAEGYLYFGAAKDLPGVREWLKREAPAAPTRSKEAMIKRLDPVYFQSVEDEELLRLEAEAEAEMNAKPRKKLKTDEKKTDFEYVKNGNQKSSNQTQPEVSGDSESNTHNEDPSTLPKEEVSPVA